MMRISGVWLMPLNWWSSIHRSFQMRMVGFTDSRNYSCIAPIYVFAFPMFVGSFTLSSLPLIDDFPESTGVKRIVQALNANVWSSVEMKDGETTWTIESLVVFL